jgi:opacity protein-like surface antigen
MRSIILSCCSILLLSKVFTQNIQGGIGIGKAAYWGDLNSPAFSTNIANNGGTALQIFLKRNMNTQAGIKMSISTMKIQANDANSDQAWQKERNLSFKSNLVELSALGEFYLFGFDPFTNEKPFSPYITAGITAGYFDPKTTYKGVEYDLQPLGTEGQGLPGYKNKYSKYFLGLPFGAGAVLKVNRAIDLNFDIIARRTFTDYLDDVSGDYVNYNELKAGNGELAAILADRTNEYLNINEPKIRNTGDQRGGANVQDWYFTVMVGISFTLAEGDSFVRKKFIKTNQCPKFKK